MGVLLEKIARFLVEFGKACESSPPPFLRMGLDADTLKEFNISHSNYGVTCVLGEGAAPICTSGGGNIERMSGADVITGEAAVFSVFSVLCVFYGQNVCILYVLYQWCMYFYISYALLLTFVLFLQTLYVYAIPTIHYII